MELKYDEHSCGIVVFRNESGIRKYLLLHYPSGHWDFPKGHVEEGESRHQTALRELEEETGIKDLKFVENFEHAISYVYNKNGKQSHKQVIFFLGETNSTEVKISFEHKSFLWLPYEESMKKLTFDNAQKILKASENFLAK
ncbi:MAG: bis(5'-nucleosyl)-tetraphosphatase [Candidatus Gracilibacteria bacterium]|nr:bis(5'-nucleosyl)-tetraphosphatase [Candidatus Gracilibacteria bacterium]